MTRQSFAGEPPQALVDAIAELHPAGMITKFVVIAEVAFVDKSGLTFATYRCAPWDVIGMVNHGTDLIIDALEHDQDEEPSS